MELRYLFLALVPAEIITVFGNVIIGTNGTVSHTAKCTFSVTGNFTNSGSYTATDNSASLTFSGSAQLLSGGGSNSCRLLTINAGSNSTFGANVSCRTFSVSGTFDPNTYLLNISNNFIIANSGTIKVNTATFAGNYSKPPTTISNTSTVNYAATTINQTVAALGYGKLVISGAMVKTLFANTTLRSGTSTTGQVSLEGGTLDLATFTLNRGVTIVGGTVTILNGTTLRIGGTNTFPANFQNSTIGSTSTVEYYGGAQTVASKPYGNLLLSQAGTCSKTMPILTTTISGNFTSIAPAGTMTIIAKGHFNALGNFTLGANSTFIADSFTDTISGTSFLNNGTITGGTGRFVLNGLAAQISGAGTFNFNDLELRRSGITAAAGINLTLSGNLTTSAAGTFTHTTGGIGGTVTFTPTITSKSIIGTGIAFNNLIINGSITTSAVFDVCGNLIVNGSKSLIAATPSVISMKGSGKSITNSATLNFFKLNIPAAAIITTASNFNMNSDLSVAGSLTASAGTVTFTGTSVLSGAANLFNVTVGGTKLTMGNNSTLGIANAFSVSTVFDVSTSTPNTVDYNGVNSQLISVNGYNRLKISGGSTKTATTGLTINENIVIASGAAFVDGGTVSQPFSHSVKGDWTNNGTFTANTSTVSFTGPSDAYIGGSAVTTFNNIIINKTLPSLVVYATNNINVATIDMSQGTVRTGTSTLNITNTRLNAGYIYGIIKRTHTFSIGTAYAFEGPSNTIRFTSGTAPTAVTVEVATDPVVGFPFGASVNRLYNISVTGGGVYDAVVRLHYLQGELNGNNEANMNLWRFSTGTWVSAGKASNDASQDWVESTSLSNITNKWTFAETIHAVAWTGATGTDWATNTNWTVIAGTPSTPPGINDIAVFGNNVYSNQPTLGTTTSIKGIEFKSATATTLTLNSGGNLTLAGSIEGVWAANATHSIAVGARSLVVNGDITLGDGIANHNLNLSASTGSITIGNSLTQQSGSVLDITGAANLTIGSDFIKTSSGAFNCGTSTTAFNGALSQLIPGVTYHNLTFSKSGGAASLANAAMVNGNLAMTGGSASQLDLNANITVLGNVSFGSSQTINCNSDTIKVSGDWTKSGTGTFIQGSGTVIFNGNAPQNLSAMNFNNLIINKSSDTLNLTGNISINGNLALSAGNLNLKTFTSNRTALGGTLSLAAGTMLKIGGASNFPNNFDNMIIPSSSTVEYNGTGAQTVKAITYGNLTFSNGGNISKSLGGSVTVNGNVEIKTNSTFDALTYTIDLYGNWIDDGEFVPSTSTVKWSGGMPNIDSTKYISGRCSFYNSTLTGRYSTTVGSFITLLNNFTNAVGGIYTQLGDSSYFYGNLYNYGTINANGVTAFMGTQVQLIVNNGLVTSNPSGVVTYLGTKAPIITSTGSTNYYTLNILNTAGIAPSDPWTVAGPFSVASGASFKGGGLTHIFLGNFYNNGNISSTGTLIFYPLFGNTVANLGTVFNSSGLVQLIGTNKITISGSTSPTFGALEISNSHVDGITPASDWTVNGNFTIFAGAKFYADTASSLLLTLGGNFTNNGSFYGRNSTVRMADTAAITGTGGITEFNNLTIASLDSALIDFSVAGNFTNNGTFTSAGYETTFIGENPSTISGSSSRVSFFDLTFSKTNSDVTLSTRLNIEKDFINNSGTQINISTDSITIAGNWTNHGRYQDSTSTNFATAYFNGAGTQIISGTNPTNFGNLNVNNGGGISVTSAQTVNGVLNLTAGAINSGGFIKLNLNRGAIAAGGLGSIAGNIITSKSVPSVGYHYISSPLNGRTAADWNDNLPISTVAPAQNYYFYNETNPSSDKAMGWTPITSTAENLNAIKGFALYFPTATTTLDMTAAYNHSNPPYSATLTFTPSIPAGSGSDGWNLVGNPFPSPLDWDASSGWTKTNVYNAIYCWDPTNNRYTSYIGGLSANSGSKYIPAMQAFWVRVDTTKSSGTLEIFNVARVTSVVNTPSLWRVAASQNILKLTATNEYNFDETIIRFQDSATIGFDGALDAYKMPSEGNTPNFLSAINGNQFSINTLPMLGKDFSLALPLSAAKSGKMKISAEMLGIMDDNIALMLYDKTKNITQDLKENPNYDFEYDRTDTTTRFYLNMIPIITALEPSNEPTIQILEYNKMLTVNFNHINENSAHIKMVDILGKTVFEASDIDPNTNKYQKDVSELIPGVYLVEVQTSQKKMSSRILIR